MQYILVCLVFLYLSKMTDLPCLDDNPCEKYVLKSMFSGKMKIEF